MARQRQAATGAAGSTGHAEPGWPTWIDAAATTRLRDAVREGVIGHAYVIAGPAGVGKAALATTFARAVCCERDEASVPERPCGACRSCRNVARGVHTDVEVFSLAAQALVATKPLRGANLTIDTVRRLTASAALLPLESERRILIVDDAETLQEPAQQALLKTLEEPPSHVTILLLTDEPEALLDTVRSRCHEIVLRPVAEAAVRTALSERGVADDLAQELARLSRGCAAWALAAASDTALLQTRRGNWETAATWVASPPYERLVTAFRLGEQFTKHRDEVIGVVQAAIEVLRDEMILRAGEQREAPLAVSAAVKASLHCLRDLEANVRPRLALETMVLAWPNLAPQPD
jgi:DNA polymerase-3 subunit delta'